MNLLLTNCSLISQPADPYFDKHEYQLDFEESNNLINKRERDSRCSVSELIDPSSRNSNYLDSPKFKPSSKAISMPAISSAQLSDISEHTEYTAKSHLNKTQQQHEQYGSGNFDEKRHSLQEHRRSECAIESNRDESRTGYPSDAENSDEHDKSSPNSVIENPKMIVKSSMKNEIEINIHKASTISDE